MAFPGEQLAALARQLSGWPALVSGLGAQDQHYADEFDLTAPAEGREALDLAPGSIRLNEQAQPLLSTCLPGAAVPLKMADAALSGSRPGRWNGTPPLQ